MEILLGLGITLAAVIAVTGAVLGIRPSSQDRGLGGFKNGPGGTAQRLAGLLAAPTGGNARVYPYTLGRLDPSALSEDESGLRFAVDGLCPSVTLWRTGFSNPSGVDLREAQKLGDPEMDGALRFAGPPAHVFALLTAPTRNAIRELLHGSVRLGHLLLEGGTLTVDVPTSGFAREHPGLETAARAIGALATLLRPPSDLVARLAENVARDPVPAVRLESLRVLVSTYGQQPGTRAAVVSALNDADPFVRLEAAIEAKAQGRETLVRLAIDLDTSEACAARAIRVLGPQHLPLDRVETLVQESGYPRPERKPRPAVTDAFLAVLAAVPGQSALDLLARLAGGAHAGRGPAIVQAIVAKPAPAAERLLIQAVESPGFDRPRTVTAAAKHLEKLGSVDAVKPLQDAASRYGGSVAGAARRAVEAIQARAASTRGRLTLSDSEAGRLSEATDPSGRVSLPDEDG